MSVTLGMFWWEVRTHGCVKRMDSGVEQLLAVFVSFLLVEHNIISSIMSPSLFYFYAVVVDCGSLASPTNGRVLLTTTTFDSTATYECDTGFNLIGDMERTCQENGQWTGGAPTCEGIITIYYTLSLLLQVFFT